MKETRPIFYEPLSRVFLRGRTRTGVLISGALLALCCLSLFCDIAVSV